MTAPTVDTSTEVAGLRLPNPVMTAAGCAVAGRELSPFLDVAGLGAVVTRTVTLDPRAGGPMPRVVETPSGMVSAVGLQNPGLEGFLATELPWLAQCGARTVVSIGGVSLGEYGELARRVGASPGVCAVEVNLAAPDPGGARSGNADTYQAAKVLGVVRAEVPRGVPVLAKLGVTGDLLDLARAVEKGGADAVVALDAPPGMALDPATLRPALGAVTGGLSGPAVHPLAVAAVWRLHAALPGLPIVGVGGVHSGFDALELMAAGASAVQVGAATVQDPSAPARVVRELHDELAARGVPRAADMVGWGHRPEGDEA